MNNLQEHIQKGTKWTNLPVEIRNSLGGNDDVYYNTLKKFSIERELSYESSPCKMFLPKQKYYADMVDYLQTKLKVSCNRMQASKGLMLSTY